MENDISSNKIMDDLDKIIQYNIDKLKEQNKKPTREEIIDIIVDRLEDLLRESSDSKEKTWILSGIAIGISIVMYIDKKLEEIKY